MYGKTYGPFLDPVSQCEHDLQSPGCAMSQRLNRPGKVLNWVPGWWFRLDTDHSITAQVDYVEWLFRWKIRWYFVTSYWLVWTVSLSGLFYRIIPGWQNFGTYHVFSSNDLICLKPFYWKHPKFTYHYWTPTRINSSNMMSITPVTSNHLCKDLYNQCEIKYSSLDIKTNKYSTGEQKNHRHSNNKTRICTGRPMSTK